MIAMNVAESPSSGMGGGGGLTKQCNKSHLYKSITVDKLAYLYFIMLQKSN